MVSDHSHRHDLETSVLDPPPLRLLDVCCYRSGHRLLLFLLFDAHTARVRTTGRHCGRSNPFGEDRPISNLPESSVHQFIISGNQPRQWSSLHSQSTSQPVSDLVFCQHLNPTCSKRTSSTFKDDIEAIRMTEKDPRKVFISHRHLLAFLRQVYATKPMHISSEAIVKQITAWPFPKRSPIYRSMDWMSV